MITNKRLREVISYNPEKDKLDAAGAVAKARVMLHGEFARHN